MRAINFVSKMVKENRLDSDKYRDVRMHMIAHPELMESLTASSKMNASWEFFQYLKEIGQRAAGQWLRKNKDDIGIKATVDIAEVFLAKHETVEEAKAAHAAEVAKERAA